MIYVALEYLEVHGVFTSLEAVANYWETYKQEASVCVYLEGKNYVNQEAEEYLSVYECYLKFHKKEKKDVAKTNNRKRAKNRKKHA